MRYTQQYRRIEFFMPTIQGFARGTPGVLKEYSRGTKDDLCPEVADRILHVHTPKRVLAFDRRNEFLLLRSKHRSAAKNDTEHNPPAVQALHGRSR